MQGHKRTARSERHFSPGQESAGTTLLTGTKLAGGMESNPSAGGDERDDDGTGSNGGDGGGLPGSGNPDRSHAAVSHRLLEAATDIDAQVVYRNLWLFIWLKTIGSFDSGAFSAALGAEDGIGATWQLNLEEQGVLTSSVFLGNVFGCPLAGHLFSRYNEKRVLCGALILHTLFTFLFAAMPTVVWALLNRFFVGLTLSFIVVYTPVWVDEFAPKKRQSVWMASHNAGVPLGVMLGYIFAVGPQMVLKGVGWNWAFYLKCLAMIPTIVYVARVDTRTINTIKTAASNDKEADAENANNAAAAALGVASTNAAVVPTAAAAAGNVAGNDSRGGGESGGGGRSSSGPLTLAVLISSVTSTARTYANRVLSTPLDNIPTRVMSTVRYNLARFASFCGPIFCNVVYICSVASLTSLYFVATGLQNFVTQYLQEPPFNASMFTIMLGFGSAVVTAPVCGVIVGGILLDRIGGYKRNLWRVTLFLFFWGSCAVFFSIVCIFAETTRSFLLVMSAVLFCGGALIPPGAGLTMASLPDHLRSTGAAFSQTMYNLLGNFSGPLVCGFVAGRTGRLRNGIITLLLSSALGVVPLFGILIVACLDAPLLSEVGGGMLADEANNTGGGGVRADDVVLVEDAYEMDSVVGEVGDEAPKEATVASEASRLPNAAPHPQQSRRGERPLNTEAHRHMAARELTTFNDGATSRVGVGAVAGASPPERPVLPAASPTSVMSVAGASPSLSSPPPQQPQRVPLVPVSARGGSINGGGVGGRGGIPAPGTAHPVRRPPLAVQPSSLQGAGEMQRSETAASGAVPPVANLEVVTLDSQAAQAISQPAEQSYGIDLVRSWLSTQQQQERMGKQGSLASGVAPPQVT